MDILEQVPCGHPPTIDWDAHTPQPTVVESRRDATPEVLSPVRRPGQKDGLSGLGGFVFDYRHDLLIFYLIGCAFHGGKRSLRAIAKEFKTREEARSLPEGVDGIVPSTVSGTMNKLAEEIFAKHFGKDSVALYEVVGERGLTTTSLTPDGERAWEATRDFLDGIDELPNW